MTPSKPAHFRRGFRRDRTADVDAVAVRRAAGIIGEMLANRPGVLAEAGRHIYLVEQLFPSL